MRFQTIAALLMTVVVVNSTLAADTLTGTWKINVKSRGRSRPSILKLTHDDNRLAGVMLNYLGPQSMIEEASFENGEVTFSVSRTRSGRTYKTRYSGIFKNGKMEGTTSVRRRGETRAAEWVGERTFDSPISTEAVQAPPVEADIVLNDDNYEVWRNHILPHQSEMAWSQIPWFSTLKDGILAANTTGKPLLLWTMNGHPLGCT
jgi:hypothetical protein